MEDRHSEHYKIRALLDLETKEKILTNLFEKHLGYHPNMEDPQTFNEKIMWYRLYYQNPLITRCADKFTVKEYAADIIGSEHIVKTIGSWSDPDEIDFSSLPDSFVLKVNWSSGYNIIVPDKSKLNITKAKEKLKGWIRPERNAYYDQFNWGYKNIKPVIYAEEYLEQIAGQVIDYKFYICGGEYEYMFVAQDRANHGLLTYDFFDKDFNHIPCTYGGKKNTTHKIEKPRHYNEMIELAKQLAKPFPFVRVDFYEIEDRILLGEMTFYSGSGSLAFSPQKWDRILGEKIPIPEKMITDKEDTFFRIRKTVKKTQLGIIAAGKKFIKKAVHKVKWSNRKYLSVFGLRFPYETHVEKSGKFNKKYIHIFGVEFCYKKTPFNAKANTDIKYEYKENPPLTAFLMEDKISPEIRRIHCEQKAYKELGYFPDLYNPQTLNEKIIWLALYYKNPIIAEATDKGKAKEWISSRIGEQYVVPLLGIYDDVNKISFADLPTRFVAKLNDGWAGNKIMIVRDKSKLGIDKTKAILSSWLYPWNNYYYQNMCITDEKMEKATIVIEELLDPGNGEKPADYKLYFCNGQPEFALVVSGRGADSETRTFVDMSWEPLLVSRDKKRAAKSVQRPEHLDEMIRIGKELSKDVPFVRIDYYEVHGRIYVGELTFIPGMFLRFSSKIMDYRLGEFLDISKLVQKQHEIEG